MDRMAGLMCYAEEDDENPSTYALMVRQEGGTYGLGTSGLMREEAISVVEASL